MTARYVALAMPIAGLFLLAACVVWLIKNSGRDEG